MKLNYLPIIVSLFKGRILKRNVPLAVSWVLTFRCNQRCLYCGIWKEQCPELTTSEILNMIYQLRQLGTNWISFTGGEPLLREDIGEVIKYAKSKKIYVSVSSNGWLLPERIRDLEGVDRIKLSLDGPKEINDYIRGEGVFERVIESITLCKKRSIPVRIECVLSKYSLNCIDFLINLAIQYKIIVSFQPPTKKLLRSEEPNLTAPFIREYQKVVIELIKLKKKGVPIYNSLSGLKHLYYWPGPRKISCTAGRLCFDIEPNGSILACNRLFCKIYNRGVNVKINISEIQRINSCKECWCSSMVEFNLINSFNINAIINFFKTY